VRCLQLEFHQLDERYSALRVSDRQAEYRLLADLDVNGQQSPVLVVAAGEGRFVLIDGYRRVAALRRLKQDTVRALLLPMDEADALLYKHRSDHQRQRPALEDAWLLRELVDRHGVSREDVAKRLQRSRSWVCRRLALIKVLPEPVQSSVREGTLCAHGAMKYLVPLARANKEACVTLVANLKGERVSVRQLATLYVTWRGANAEQRRRLVSEPLLFLKVAGAAGQQEPHDARARGADIVNDVEAIGAICRRACHRLRQGTQGQRMATRRFERVWQETCLAFEALSETVKEHEDVGQVHPSGCAQAPAGRARDTSHREGTENHEEVRAEDPGERHG